MKNLLRTEAEVNVFSFYCMLIALLAYEKVMRVLDRVSIKSTYVVPYHMLLLLCSVVVQCTEHVMECHSNYLFYYYCC